jgi:hypothetical protein
MFTSLSWTSSLFTLRTVYKRLPKIEVSKTLRVTYDKHNILRNLPTEEHAGPGWLTYVVYKQSAVHDIDVDSICQNAHVTVICSLMQALFGCLYDYFKFRNNLRLVVGRCGFGFLR